MALLKLRPKKQSITVFALIILVGALSFLLTALQGDQQSTEPQVWIFFVMKLYLIFIFLRTVLHILLCFANTIFEKPVPAAEIFPLVSILIPCYNEEKVLTSAIRAVTNFTYPNLEIIIIDDGSSDTTLEVAQSLELEGRIRVIHQSNAGKAAALNRGLSESQGDYFMCIDADSQLNRECIDQGIRHFSHDPNLAAVAGSVEIGNREGVIPSFQRLEYVSGLNLFKSAQSFLRMVTVIPGPVGLFKKSAVEEVGGYKLETYAEDCELTLRLLTAGYRTVYDPTMIAITEAPEELSSLVSQRYRWSRGVFQAILVNKSWLLHPIRSPRNFVILAYMIIESVLIPTCNFVFAFVALWYSLQFASNIVGYFFIQLMFLDVVLALYCSIADSSPFSLVGYSILNRFTYGFSLEIVRFLSIIDECINLPMSWGKLTRKGL